VALRLPNTPVFIAAWLAIQKIGAVGVATMPMLRARELGYLVNDCGVAVFLCAHELMDELAKARIRFAHSVIVIETDSRVKSENADYSLDDLLLHSSSELAAHATGRDDISLIAYTSGSTGEPKGTIHTPADILASSDGYAKTVLEPTRTDVFGGHPTMAFTFGLGGLLIFPFRFGATTALIDRYSPEMLLSSVAKRRVTLLFCAATSYRMLLQDPHLEEKYDLSSIRLCVSAGETLPESVYREWYRRTGIEILDGIGATEMFHVFISSRAGNVRPGATGLPVPGYEAQVVDDQLREVARGAPGLLAVRGPTGCRYWGKPDRQREYVRNGWNLTGDIYVQDEDGYFWYQCRNDDLIVCGGYNVAGPEVERVLLEHPAVLETAVVASPDPDRGFVPKAFVVLTPGMEGSEELGKALQDYVKRELAPYKYPREVEFITALPKTETGKIRRVELRDLERQRKTVVV
jgi:2-aminobenzoate-CoA ligase